MRFLDRDPVIRQLTADRATRMEEIKRELVSNEWHTYFWRWRDDIKRDARFRVDKGGLRDAFHPAGPRMVVLCANLLRSVSEGSSAVPYVDDLRARPIALPGSAGRRVAERPATAHGHQLSPRRPLYHGRHEGSRKPAAVYGRMAARSGSSVVTMTCHTA